MHRNRHQALYIFLIAFLLFYLLYKLFSAFSASLFFNRPSRLNVVIYGPSTVYYSFDSQDKQNYRIQFDPEVKVDVPGGYGKYRVGSLGKLVKLEHNPEIFKKTFSPQERILMLRIGFKQILLTLIKNSILRYILFIAPFLLGLSGLNHIFYYITLTYQIYVFVILLICLLFWEPLKTNRANILLFALLSLLVWSGPYSVLVAPFSLCFILFFRGKTAFLTALTVVVVLYTLSVSNNMILLRNLWKPAIHEVWLGTLVGKVFFMGMGGAFTVKKLMLCLGFFLGLLAIFRRDSFYLKIACLLLVLINSSLAALFLSKKYMISLRVLPCYLVIAQFFWLFFLLFTADRLLALRKGLYHGGLVVALLAVLFIYRDDTLHPYKWSFPTMPKLAEFLQLVHDSEQLDLAGQHKGRILQFGHKSFRPVVRVGKTDDPNAAVEQIVMEEQ